MTPAPPWLAFGTVWFTYFAAIGSYNTYAPLWFKELGFSTLAIGAIASLQAWTRVFAPYAWGWWGDHGRHGGHRVRLLRLSCAASLLAALALLWVRDTPWVAVAVALLFIANGGVVIPAYGSPLDQVAADVVAKAHPDRRVVQVDVGSIPFGGGGIHCITQQEPAV